MVGGTHFIELKHILGIYTYEKSIKIKQKERCPVNRKKIKRYYG